MRKTQSGLGGDVRGGAGFCRESHWCRGGHGPLSPAVPLTQQPRSFLHT